MASEEFIPAAQFDGAKPGYMFQMVSLAASQRPARDRGSFSIASLQAISQSSQSSPRGLCELWSPQGTKGLGYYVDKKQRKDQGGEAAGKSAGVLRACEIMCVRPNLTKLEAGPKREVVGFANDGSFME